MLHPLHITLDLGLRNSKKTQEFGQDPMAFTDFPSNGTPLLR